MPAVTFFAMYRACLELQAIERAHMCDMLSVMFGVERYQYMKDRYVAMIETPKMPEKPVRSIEPLPVESQQTREAMFSIFAAAKGLH